MRDWLQKYRESKNMTHEAVAEAASIKRAYYTMIENGTRNPSVAVAKRIGNALGFRWIIFFEERSNETTHIIEPTGTDDK